jgi:hypothetical protein
VAEVTPHLEEAYLTGPDGDEGVVGEEGSA